jgi:phage head maturation protease
VTVPLCGYTLCWNSPGHPDAGRRFSFRPHCLDRWLASGMGVPLRVDHQGTVTSRGIVDTVGAARRFRADGYGLLTLLELDDEHGYLADSVRRGWLWGLSGGYADLTTDPPNHRPHEHALVRHLVVRDFAVLDAALTEVSLTDQPSDPNCRVLGVGDEALELWRYPMLDKIALTVG